MSAAAGAKGGPVEFDLRPGRRKLKGEIDWRNIYTKFYRNFAMRLGNFIVRNWFHSSFLVWLCHV